MIYRFIDGKEFEARSAEELVAKIRESSYTPGSTIEEFMVGLARRADILQFGSVRTDTMQNFVADLLNHSIIRTQTVH